MTVNGVVAVTLRYFTEFVKPVYMYFQHRVYLWRNLCTSLLYFVMRVRCCRKESLRSLSHLLMSFLFCLSMARFGAKIFALCRDVVVNKNTRKYAVLPPRLEERIVEPITDVYFQAKPLPNL